MKKLTVLCCVLTALACLQSPAVCAQQVDFEFTGTVESSGGALGSVVPGSNVSGTFSIELSNATDTSCYVAPVRDPFRCEAASGSSVTGASSTDYVITYVVNFDGFTYRSTDLPQGAYLSSSDVEGASGINFNGSEHNWWNGSEMQLHEALPTDNQTQSSINLYNSDGPAYTNTGYPQFAGATFGRGFLCMQPSGNTGCISYDITSVAALSSVPVYVAPTSSGSGSGSGSAGWAFLLALLAVRFFRIVRTQNKWPLN